VRERLTRLAELIRKDGAAYPLTPVLVDLWVDVLADLTPQQVAAAFSKAEQNLKFWPAPAEVRAFLPIAEKIQAEEAAQKWNTVLTYAMRCSPDYPDNPPRGSFRGRKAQSMRPGGWATCGSVMRTN
jgi:hypothetical protein